MKQHSKLDPNPPTLRQEQKEEYIMNEEEQLQYLRESARTLARQAEDFTRTTQDKKHREKLQAKYNAFLKISRDTDEDSELLKFSELVESSNAGGDPLAELVASLPPVNLDEVFPDDPDLNVDAFLSELDDLIEQ